MTSPHQSSQRAISALTLHQLWAPLVAHGVKTTETRSWVPPRSAISKYLAIHAGKTTARTGDLHPATLAAVIDL